MKYPTTIIAAHWQETAQPMNHCEARVIFSEKVMDNAAVSASTCMHTAILSAQRRCEPEQARLKTSSTSPGAKSANT